MLIQEKIPQVGFAEFPDIGKIVTTVGEGIKSIGGALFPDTADDAPETVDWQGSTAPPSTPSNAPSSITNSLLVVGVALLGVSASLLVRKPKRKGGRR